MIGNDSAANINLIYAGNLDKSLFLRRLQDVGFNNEFKMFLYGAYSDNIPNTEGVEYKGKFAADRFDSIEGNWGLFGMGSLLILVQVNMVSILKLIHHLSSLCI